METRKYREDQIAKLRDLLRETTKAIQLGDNHYHEANDAYQKSKSTCEKLETSCQKLDGILKEQEKQLQVLSVTLYLTSSSQ
jgi:ribosome recycling factor